MHQSRGVARLGVYGHAVPATEELGSVRASCACVKREPGRGMRKCDSSEGILRGWSKEC